MREVVPLPGAGEARRWAAARSRVAWRGPEEKPIRQDRPTRPARCPLGHHRTTSPSQAQRQVRPSATAVQLPVPPGGPGRARVRCAPSPAYRAVVVAPGPDRGGRVAGARPCWRRRPCLGPAACPRHRGPGCGVVGWRVVRCRRRGGVSWRAWGASSVAGGRGRRRGPWGVSAAPGPRREGVRGRAVVPGRGAVERVVPWDCRRVSRRLARSTGRCTRGWRR